ncbi:uncharacterized protein NEMAJ01_0700 [Nematocida major]|uniref:uncharacterized protein n=1 Tax=Nematocida major TaxID=1912982 RepID=UPI0020088A55|nr:uncharacterized protein NEMAJ01_0700 [Nematocida major]KAH9385804.1 hypothetical protein NEMAJ01_0700 [Nematocida major]
MITSYKDFTKRTNCTTVFLTGIVVYFVSVILLWKHNGFVHFLWALVKKPVSLFCVDFTVFLSLEAISLLFYGLVKASGKYVLPKTVVFIGLFITVGATLLVIRAGKVEPEDFANIFITCKILTGLLYMEISGMKILPAKTGIFSYLKKIYTKTHLIFLGIFPALFPTHSPVDAFLSYALLSLILHIYVFNVNYFAQNLRVLSQENKTFSKENQMILTNYSKSTDLLIFPEKMEKSGASFFEVNNHVLFGYAVDLLFLLQENIRRIVSRESVSRVIVKPKVVRQFPAELLSGGDGGVPIEKSEGSIPYRIWFFYYSRHVYAYALEEAKLSQDILKRLTRGIWQMDASYRRKLLQQISDVKTEVKKIRVLDASELYGILNMWAFHLTT